MIAKQALTLLNSNHNTVVVSDDTYILVLLIHYCDGHDLPTYIFFHTQQKSQKLFCKCSEFEIAYYGKYRSKDSKKHFVFACMEWI